MSAAGSEAGLAAAGDRLEPLLPYFLALCSGLSRRGRHAEAADLLRQARRELGADQEEIGGLLVDELARADAPDALLTAALELLDLAPVAAAKALSSLQGVRPVKLPNGAARLLDRDWAEFARREAVPAAVRADVVAAVAGLLQAHQRFTESATLLGSLPPELVDDLRVQLLLGKALDVLRQWPAASTLLTRAVNNLSATTPPPLAESVRHTAATLHERLGRPEQALPLLDPDATTTDAARARGLALRALCLVQTGRAAQARADVAASDALADAHVAPVFLAWALLGLGDVEEAVRRAGEGLRRHPESEELSFLKCQAEIAAGDEIGKSVHRLTKLVARMHAADLEALVGRTRRVRAAGGAELDASAHYVLAVVARAANRADDARAEADQALAGLASVPAPTRGALSGAVRRLRGELLADTDPGAAAAEYAAAGNEAFEAGDWPGAVELLTAARRLGRLGRPAGWNLAEAHYLTSFVPALDRGLAEPALRAAQEVWDETFAQALPDVEDGWTYVSRGRIEMGLARLERRFPERALRTLQYCECALMLGAPAIPLAELYTSAIRMLGLYGVGAEVLTQALAAEPADASILASLFYAAVNGGDVEMARAHLSRASENTAWHEDAGRVLVLAGDPRAALDESAHVAESERALSFRWLEFVAYASLNDDEGVTRVLDTVRADLDDAAASGAGDGSDPSLRAVFSILLGRTEAAQALIAELADDDSWWTTTALDAALLGLLGPDAARHEEPIRRFIDDTRSYEDVLHLRAMLGQLGALARRSTPDGGSPGGLDAVLDRLVRAAEQRLERGGWPATAEGDLAWLRRLAGPDATPEQARLAALVEAAIAARRALDHQNWPAAVEAYRTLAAHGSFPEAEQGLVIVAIRTLQRASDDDRDAVVDIVRRLTEAVPALGGVRRRPTAADLLETRIGDLQVRLGELALARRTYEAAAAVVGEREARHLVTARLHVGGVLLGDLTGAPGPDEVLATCRAAAVPVEKALLDAGDVLVHTPAGWDRLADVWEEAAARLAGVDTEAARQAGVLVAEATARSAAAWRREGDLDAAAARLRRAYERHRDVVGDDDPEVLTRRIRLAEVLREQGRSAEAAEELRPVVEARSRLLGPDDPATLGARFDLGVTLLDQGRADEAAAEFEPVATAQLRVAGPDAAATWDARYRLAQAQRDQGRLDEAERTFREVLEADERLQGADGANALATRSELAGVLARMGRLDEAAAHHRAIVDARVRTLGEGDPATLTARLSLVRTLKALGSWAEVEAEAATLVETSSRVLGDDDRTTLTARFEAAAALQDQGRVTEAEAALSDLFQQQQRVLGDDDLATWDTGYRLAQVVQEQGRLEEAEGIYRRVLAADQRLRGQLDEGTLLTRYQLALVVAWQGRYAEAETDFRAVAADRTEVLGPDDPATLKTRRELAIALQRQERFEEARDEFAAVLAGQERVLGADAPITWRARHELAWVRYELGEVEAAIPELRAAVAGLVRTSGPDDTDALAARFELASLLLERGLPAEAEEEFRAVAEGRARVLGDDLATWLAWYYVGVAQHDQREWPAAEQTYREVLDAESRLQGAGHPSTLMTRRQLAQVLREQGRLTDALDELRRVVDGRSAALGPTDPTTVASRFDLGILLLQAARPAQAAIEFREVAQARADTLDPDDLRTWGARYQLAVALEEQQDLEAAERGYREVLAAETRLLGADDPDTLVTHYRLAVVLRLRDRPAEAEAELGTIVQQRVRLMGETAPPTSRARYQLGLAVGAQQRHDEAERAFRQLLASELELRGADDEYPLLVGHQLGLVLLRQGRSAEAVDVLRDLLADRARSLVASGDELRAAWTALARSLTGADVEPADEADATARQELETFLRELSRAVDADSGLPVGAPPVG
jgi:tetratricopeptide (TPR) repeat protein